jgi:hypothetical protein
MRRLSSGTSNYGKHSVRSVTRCSPVGTRFSNGNAFGSISALASREMNAGALLRRGDWEF